MIIYRKQLWFIWKKKRQTVAKEILLEWDMCLHLNRDPARTIAIKLNDDYNKQWHHGLQKKNPPI